MKKLKRIGVFTLIFMLFMSYVSNISIINAETFREIPLKRGVNLDKQWNVKFNKIIDSSTVNNTNIKLLDENNREVSIKVERGQDLKSIKVTPIEKYSYGKEYYLVIGSGVKSSDGKFIKPTRMKFIAKKPLPQDPQGTVGLENKFTICIDPGQLWADYVVGSKGVLGKDINLSVARKLGAILEAKGAKVIFTRTSDTVNWNKSDDGIANRISISEGANTDLFLSINTNSYNEERVNGIETYYLDTNAQGKSLAEDVQKELVADINGIDRGAKTRTSTQSKLLSGTSTPSIMIELGFITNKGEELKLIDPLYQEKYAQAIAKAIIRYAGTAEIDKPTINTVEDINKTINQGDAFSLPNSVTAVMSDGTKKSMNVQWNVSSIDTSKAGTFTYYGKVEGYIGMAKLSLKIVQKEPEKKKYKVTINPSRGGFDNGAIGSTGLKEKDVNLDVALRAGKILAQKGVDVIYTRTSDNVTWNKDNEIAERVKISNDAKADLMVSIGVNSHTTETANGIETLYMDGNSEGKELAQFVENELVKRTGGNYRGVKGVTYLNTLKLSNAPSIWATLGFITNKEEEKELADSDYRQSCAVAIANGVMSYIAENPQGPNGTNTDTSDKVYFKDIIQYVQRGQSYSLPSQLKITLDSGTTQNVNVSWSTTKVDTSKVGLYRYEGTIKESSKLVSLILIVTESGQSKFKVALDPGHGGYDPGAIGISTGVKEKDISLPIALKVGDYLIKNGVQVVYTRTSDNVTWPSNERLDLQARCDIANNAKVDLFVSIHENKFYKDTAYGIETYHFRGSTSGYRVASIIQSELISATGAFNRGVKGAGYYVLDKVDTTSVLIETGFLSNPTEEKKLTTDAYQTKLAKAITTGILKSLGITNIKLD